MALSPAAPTVYSAVMVRQYLGNGDGSGGWVTTRQAAAALRLQPRQIRNLIGHGELEAQTEGEGVNRRYLVSIASVDALRQKRQEEGKLPGKDRDVAESAVMPGQPGQDVPALARELAASLEEAGYRLGKAEARLELTAEAESTIREALDRERERADLERARADRLEAELLATRREPLEPQESSDKAPSHRTGAADETLEGSQEAPEAGEGPQMAKSRPWWLRIIGG